MRVRNYSVSALNSFRSCPLQFYYSYIDRKPTPSSAEAFVGHAVHASVQSMNEKIAGGRLPNLLEALAGFHERWEDGWQRENVVIFRDGNDEAFYRGVGERCVKFYHSRHRDLMMGETVVAEERIYTKLGPGEVPFVVVPDRISRVVEVGVPGEYVVHDYKTKAKAPSGHDLRTDRQLPLYETALREKWPDARRVRLAWHYLALEQSYEVTRERAEREAVIASLLDDVAAVEAAKEFPPKPSPLCHWCMHWERCPAQRFRKREVVDHRPVSDGPAVTAAEPSPAAAK
jgi:putative RecB family exonuclease